jgi:hypothetical protein
VLLALAFSFGLFAQKGKVFDLSESFEFSQTSDSTWQYGYSETPSLDPEQFRLDNFLDNVEPICFWHPSTNSHPGSGYYPYVAFNRSKKSETEPTHGWAVRAGEIAMEASNSGQYSLVRFTAPVSGRYKVEAQFEGIHFHLSSTDVHVLRGTAHLFDAEIEGYGGDPAFHAIEGAHPKAMYSGTLDLRAHDTVIFAVGYGKNRTHYNDTTGLFARLILLR